jgi:hypothetical protein
MGLPIINNVSAAHNPSLQDGGTQKWSSEPLVEIGLELEEHIHPI